MFEFLKRWFGRSQKIDRAGLVDSSGMVVGASTAPNLTDVPISTDTIEIISKNPTPHVFKCGHTGPSGFVISLYGTKTKPFKRGKTCAECIVKEMRESVIRCALCGRPIIPGDPVAMYHESSRGLRKDIGYKVNDSFLGCLSTDCCPSGGFFAGHWTGDKFQPMFDNGNSVAAQVMATGRTVIVSDTSQV